MKKIDRYTLYARYFPGFITAIPISLIYFFLTKHYSDFALNEYLKSATFILGLPATFVLSYLLSILVRELGCFLERRYFQYKSGFPTTYLMLYSHSKLPTQIKEKYSQKILDDFQLTRPTQEQEQTDSLEAIKVLGFASRHLATRYQQHDQVKDANIGYGFSRNVSGGLFISIPTATIGVIIGWYLNEHSLMLWSCGCLFVFIMIACFHRSWIRLNSEKYAEKIFSLYLGIRPTESFDR